MILPKLAFALGVSLTLGSCTSPNVARRTGFIDNYTVLRPGADDPNTLVRVDTSFDITDHNKVILNPVTVWRSEKYAIGDLPSSDIQRLTNTFRGALSRELERNGFELVTTPGETTMVLSAAITDEERANWVYRDPATSPGGAGGSYGAQIAPSTLAFLRDASFETEIADTNTGIRIAHTTSPHGMQSYSGSGGGGSWGDVEAAADTWSKWYVRRLRAWTHASYRLYR